VLILTDVRIRDGLPPGADAMGFERQTKSLQTRHFCAVERDVTAPIPRSVDTWGTLSDVVRAALRTKKGLRAGLFEAADGTRTHDLLHGKQNLIRSFMPLFACKLTLSPRGGPTRIRLAWGRFRWVLRTISESRSDGQAVWYRAKAGRLDPPQGFLTRLVWHGRLSTRSSPPCSPWGGHRLSPGRRVCRTCCPGVGGHRPFPHAVR
jgi:hypothetical protein